MLLLYDVVADVFVVAVDVVLLLMMFCLAVRRETETGEVGAQLCEY